MRSSIISASALLLFFRIISAPVYANMLSENSDLRLKAFMTKTDTAGISAELKGKIDSFSSNSRVEKNDVVRSAQDKTRVTVRLYNNDGMKKGDILFVINDKNLIVSKVRVDQIYLSKSFGYMMIGFGNFRFATEGDRVVQKIEDAKSKYAYKFKARGDYFANRGDTGAAIVEYKKCIEYDRGYPEAHFELGNIYYQDSLFELAIQQYDTAYENIHRMADEGDKYLLLKKMAKARLAYLQSSTSLRMMNQKKKDEITGAYRADARKFCLHAIEINPRSSESYYILGRLVYEQSDAPRDSDAEAKKYFVKALELNPGNSNAAMYLGILYKRNGNTKKAIGYFKKAIEADQSNQRARDWLKKIK